MLSDTEDAPVGSWDCPCSRFTIMLCTPWKGSLTEGSGARKAWCGDEERKQRTESNSNSYKTSSYDVAGSSSTRRPGGRVRLQRGVWGPGRGGAGRQSRTVPSCAGPPALPPAPPALISHDEHTPAEQADPDCRLLRLIAWGPPGRCGQRMDECYAHVMCRCVSGRAARVASTAVEGPRQARCCVSPG